VIVHDQINQSERRQINGSSSSRRKVSPSSGTGGDVGFRPHCHRHLRSRQRGHPEALGDPHPGRGCAQRAESHPPSGPSILRLCGEHQVGPGQLTRTLSAGQGPLTDHCSGSRACPQISDGHTRGVHPSTTVPLPRRTGKPRKCAAGGAANRSRHPSSTQGLDAAPAQALRSPHTLTPRAGTRRTRRAGRRPPRPAWPSP